MTSCLLCGAAESREVFRLFRPKSSAATGRHTEDLFGRAGRLEACEVCGVVRQIEPSVADYEDAEDALYLSEEAGIRQTFRGILERLEEHHSPGRLLDVGCGPGLLLDEARTRGWTAIGVEPSVWSSEEARRRGLDVRTGFVQDVDLGSSPFDAVVAADVIEHVPDPVAFAARLRELLSPGGVVFIATPNVKSVPARLLRRWWWSVIPNHLWLFTPRSLFLVLQQAGLEVLDSSTDPKTFSVDYYAGRFGGYLPVLGRLARAGARLVGGRDRLVTPDLRDRLAVIARRPC